MSPHAYIAVKWNVNASQYDTTILPLHNDGSNDTIDRYVKLKAALASQRKPASLTDRNTNTITNHEADIAKQCQLSIREIARGDRTGKRCVDRSVGPLVFWPSPAAMVEGGGARERGTP